ncbi:MAG: hypothetical protein IPF41_05985 [Flavobacteriales bacterium]|nr:hypothetical protein [Flavobacteriales bacterium]
MAGVLVAVLMWRHLEVVGLAKYSKYTVARTTKYYRTADGARNVSFTFVYYGDQVHWSSGKYDEFELNRRYFVRFDSTDARNSELLSSPAVPDTLIVIPPGGWKELPVGR